MLRYAKKLTPYLLLSHRRSIGAVMASVLSATKLKETISTTPTATSIATGYDLPSIRRPRLPFPLFPFLLCYAQLRQTDAVLKKNLICRTNDATSRSAAAAFGMVKANVTNSCRERAKRAKKGGSSGGGTRRRPSSMHGRQRKRSSARQRKRPRARY
jgi:hypothetical protein